MAKVIERVQKPTLILSHNKTLAAQLYSEFKEFFPNNAVEYFVSYYDYYQPEAYIARSDTYIEKESEVNEEIDRLRHAATRALFERRDVVIVASVSCIYGIGAPEEYGKTIVSFRKGGSIRRERVLRPPRGHPVRAQRLDARARHLPRARRYIGDLPGLRGDRAADRTVGRRGGAHRLGGPADGRSARRAQRGGCLPRQALRHQPGEVAGGDAGHRGGDDRAGQTLRAAGEAARSAAHQAAHDVRPGDALRGRLLRGHRELQPPPRPPRRPARSRGRCSITSRTITC